MWQLPVCLLLVALASADKLGYEYTEPQNGYLPPSPSNPEPVVCQPAVTSVDYINSIVTSISVRTVNQVNTHFLTTTIVKREVFPTTIFQTRVQTQIEYQTSVVQNTQVQYTVRLVEKKIPGPNIVRTQYTTLTRVVPEVHYVTRENIITQIVPVEVTNTAIQTLERTNINYSTQRIEKTYIVTLPAEEVLRTLTQTAYKTSIVQRQEPAQTRVISSTRVEQVVNTRSVQAPDQIETTIVQERKVIPTTLVHKRIDTSIVYKTTAFTQINVRTQIQLSTQIIPKIYESTRLIPNTIYTTRVEKVVQPFTVVETRIVKHTVVAPPIVQIREVTKTSVAQIRGENSVIYSEVIQTRQQERIVYATVNRAEEISITKTITAPCANTGYKYDAPLNQLTFP